MPHHPVVVRRSPEVYDPSEDTMLLANNLIVRDNDTILEIGSGCGYVSINNNKSDEDAQHNREYDEG